MDIIYLAALSALFGIGVAFVRGWARLAGERA